MIEDLFEALSKYYDSDIEAALIIRDLYKISDQKKLLDFYEDKLLSLGICPDCLVDLTGREEIANIHEYMGRPVEEWQYIKYCPVCREEY